MGRVSFACLLLAASLISHHAQADPYRWCAIYGRDGTNCYFLTIEQCRAAVSGGGFCSPNNFYDGRPISIPEERVRARRR